MFRFDVSSGSSDELELDFGDALQERLNSRPDDHALSDNPEVKQALNEEDILIAVKRNNSEAVQRILNEGFPIDRILTGGWTLLMYACSYGVPDVVNLLLKSGADAKTQIDMFSALMAVCCSQSNAEERLVECANLLIHHGAVVNTHDRHHMTPLMFACQHNKASLTQLLLIHDCDVNHQDVRGWTAFAYASNAGNEVLMQLLLQAGSNLQAVTNGGETKAVLMEASSESCILVDDPNHSALLEANDCHKYGDLEVFLLGLHLENIMPSFKKHHVNFAMLLSMTDDDLKQIDIPEIAVRHKILNAVANVHKRQWEMPERIQMSGNLLSSSEAVVTMSHLTKHSQYLQSTADVLISSITGNHHLLDSRMEDVRAQHLLCEMNKLEESVLGLQQRVIHLRREMQALELQTTLCNQQDNHTCIAAVLCLCGAVCSGLYLWFRFFR